MTPEIQKSMLAAAGRYVRKLLEPVELRLKTLESRTVEKGEPGRDGKDGRDGRDGTSVSARDIDLLIERSTAPLLIKIAELEAREIPAPIKGDPGTSVTIEDVAPLIAEAVKAIPVPQDGKSIAVVDVEPVLRGMVDSWALDFERRSQGMLERMVERLPLPEAGKDGRDGRDGLPGVPGQAGEKGMDGTHGRDGVDGKHGIDGFGFEDMAVEHDGAGLVALKFTRGDRVKSFELRLPVFRDCGVFREGETYAAGNGVTFGGSYWLAQKDAPEGKPGLSTDWRLAVKKGRDGKDKG